MPHAHPGAPTPWNVESLFARDLDVRELSFLDGLILDAVIDVAGADRSARFLYPPRAFRIGSGRCKNPVRAQTSPVPLRRLSPDDLWC
jgi:hypothetical protein